MTPRRAPPCAWKPGQSGNPKGKPKGATSSGALRDAIKKAMPQVLEALIEKAISGDVNAASGHGSFKCDTGSGDCTLKEFTGETLDLDTGSGKGGHLSAVELPRGKEYDSR